LLRIVQFEQPLGQGLRRVGLFRLHVTDMPEAVRLIEQHIRGYASHGYDGAQDYWWCRNETDKANIVLLIEPIPSRIEERTALAP
jgi:hypothetical protein